MPADSESSRLRVYIRPNTEEDTVRSMVAIDECNADPPTWMNICNAQPTDRSITNICNHIQGEIATVCYGC
jgi:hypothetical protein